MELTHPWFLALAPVLGLVIWLALRRSLAAMTSRQALIATSLRVLMLACLLLGLAGLRVLRPDRTTSVVFAVDDSASLTDEARKEARDFVREALGKRPAQDTAGVVGFASSATIWEAPTPRSELAESWPPLPARDATAVGPALDIAADLLPPSGSRRVVLLSDGNDTDGAAAEAARRAAERGIQVWTVPLRNPSAPEVLVEKVELPRSLKEGEPFDLTARIRSNIATAAKVKLYQAGFMVEQQDLALKPGLNEFRAANLHTEKAATYEVEVIAASDTSAENNRASATADLRGKPSVLIIDSDEPQLRPLAPALTDQKIQVETRGLNGLPKTLED
jgi:hypothetical protein